MATLDGSGGRREEEFLPWGGGWGSWAGKHLTARPLPSAKGIMPVPAGHHCAHKAQTREDLPHDDVGPTREASEPTGGQQHGRGDGGAHAPIPLFSADSARSRSARGCRGSVLGNETTPRERSERSPESAKTRWRAGAGTTNAAKAEDEAGAPGGRGTTGTSTRPRWAGGSTSPTTGTAGRTLKGAAATDAPPAAEDGAGAPGGRGTAGTLP